MFSVCLRRVRLNRDFISLFYILLSGFILIPSAERFNGFILMLMLMFVLVTVAIARADWAKGFFLLYCACWSLICWMERKWITGKWRIIRWLWIFYKLLQQLKLFVLFFLWESSKYSFCRFHAVKKKLVLCWKCIFSSRKLQIYSTLHSLFAFWTTMP